LKDQISRVCFDKVNISFHYVRYFQWCS